jgi:hypothetical protein
MTISLPGPSGSVSLPALFGALCAIVLHQDPAMTIARTAIELAKAVSQVIDPHLCACWHRRVSVVEDRLAMISYSDWQAW